jgi:filamentous hemagglutinin family protein
LGKVVTNEGSGRVRVRGCALASASVLSLAVMCTAAQAQPSGGSVVAGSAQISSSGATTLINQSTSKAIINWQSFSVGQGSTVQFNQPSASAITLNRVTGTSASVIDGAIRANGQVWLLNPNGLLFGNGATINVAGLLATTSDINDQDFLSGRYNFSSTGGKGAIANSGTITAGNGGSVVLSAPHVTNKGLIAASAGHVVLGGTDTFTVDFNGDHLLNYAISPNSTGGKVSNSGKIAAAGGTILMTARAAAGVQDAVINNSGMVEATSVRQENGEIILEADNGTVSDTGTLDASGKGAGQTGGTVKVLGQQVAVADGARIDVSGDAGGGTALIGGNLHGAGPEPNAQNTTVGKATINASAITSGNGGTVAVYSTGTTQVAAAITAKGGIISGKGGTVETSGHVLDFTGTSVNAGVGGTWLLDPYDLTVDSAAATTIDNTLNAGTSVTLQTTATSASSTPAGIGNVNPSGNGDIIIGAALGWTTNATLTLDAYHSIFINAPITIISPAVAGGLVLKTNDGGTGGDYSFASGVDVNFGTTNNNGSLTINGSPYTLLYCMTPAVCANNVQSINSGLTGNYALAAPLDASGVSGWVSIGTDGAGNVGNGGLGFTGTFAGLGNTISNLTINTSASLVGLFGYSDGTIRDIGVVGGSVTTTAGTLIGGLSGYNGGTVSNTYSTAAVNGTSNVGGLFGNTTAGVVNSYATGPVTATGSFVGGLAGFANGSISNSYATGTVTATGSSGHSDVGGLIGETVGANISQSHATGSVTVSGGYDAVGGLIGATVTGGAVMQSFATGSVTDLTGGAKLGGLVGVNSAAISDSYAMGAVSGSGNAIGGLVGSNTTTITTSYSTGAVIGGISAIVGGLVGANSGTVTQSYWDTDTSGLTTDGAASGSTGLQTSALQLGLPTGFSTTTWGTTGSNNLYPYLLFQGTPQVITGIVNVPLGTPVGSSASGLVTVSSFVNGSPSASATAGVNGAYYLMMPANTFTGTNQVLTYVNNSTFNSGVVANDYFQNITTSQSSKYLTNTQLALYTTASNLTGAIAGLGVAQGTNPGSDLIYRSGFPAAITLNIQSSNLTGFTVDAAVNLGNSGSFLVFASGPITQTASIIANSLVAVTSGTNADITLNNNGNDFAGGGFVTSSGNVVFGNAGNTGPTYVTNTSIHGTLTVNAPNSTIFVGESGSPLNATGLVTLNAGAGISQGSATLTAGGLSATTAAGNITLGNTGNQISGTVSLASSIGAITLTNGTNTTLGTVSAQGNIDITSNGSVVVNGPITTSSSIVVIDAGGAIQVNAPITAAAGGSGPGAIVLSANDPNLNGLASNSDSNGIVGSGLLTAASINLDAGPGLNGLSGSIGSLAQPLQVTSDTGQLSLAIRSYNGNAAINSAVAVSIDNNTAALAGFGVVLDQSAIGVNTMGSNSLYGEVSLTAAGPITQTFGIQSGNLTLTSTGSAGAITLADQGCQSSCDFVDPANSVFGTLYLNSSGNATFYNNPGGVASPITLNVGASNVSGALALYSASAEINIGDPAGGTVQAGSVFLQAGAAGGISISSPLVSNTSIVMSAGLGISQNTSTTGDIHIQAGTTLFAQAFSGSITLGDLGNGSGDPGNHIAGQAVLQANVGNVTFANVPGITLGTDSTDDPGTPYSLAAGGFIATTPGNITIAPGASISAGSMASPGSVSISLQAGGNFINNSGLAQQTLLPGNTTYFNIYSANPANDVFSGLDSGNTAVWNTAAGAPITAQANRYIFAFQPTLTVNVGNVNKLYGTDDSAVLQSLAGAPTGLEPGVVGAFVGDTAASVYSGTPTLTSAGTTASANVGVYSIVANLAVGDGYAFTASGILTVTPQTLFYNAAGVSRIYGSANPASFGGTVIGFVNGDTLASATAGSLAFSSTATAASGAGSYAITGSGLSAVNYVFQQAAANASALTITPAILTYTANTASRVYGMGNPAFSGSVTGFVNGDTLVSATAGTLVFTTSATSTSPVGSYAIDGSGLNAANYTFIQAPGNATALTIIARPPAPQPSTLASFTNSIQPPQLSNVTDTPLGQLNLIMLSVVPPPPPPPSPPTPPPVQSPLTDLSDTPNSSDQTTSQIANSLDGNNNAPPGAGPDQNSGDGVVIPRILVNGHPPAPPPTDISTLSSFGNFSLWQ